MSISKKVRQQVTHEARGCCGYCRTQEIASGIPLTLEHIMPKSRGGSDLANNLWLSCRLCNEAKGIQIEAKDPLSNISVPLYNPRTERWSLHFTWDEQGTHILGLTPTGRATIQALFLNDNLRVRARGIWKLAGYHPPMEE